MGFISANIGKLLGGVALFALYSFAVFQWGKAECEADYERAARKTAEAHAVVVVAATDATADLAIDDNKKDSTNDRQNDKVTDIAAAEAGADDLCLSDDVIDGLLDLQ